MIDGENNELKLNFYRGVNFNLFDEINQPEEVFGCVSAIVGFRF